MYADIYYNILSRVDVKTLYRTQSVCKLFQQLSIKVLSQTTNETLEPFVSTIGTIQGTLVSIAASNFKFGEYKYMFTDKLVANGIKFTLLIHRKKQYISIYDNTIYYNHNSAFSIDYVINFMIGKMFKFNPQSCLTIEDFKSKFCIKVKYQFKINSKRQSLLSRLSQQMLDDVVKQIKRQNTVPIESDKFKIIHQNKCFNFSYNKSIIYFYDETDKKIGEYKYLDRQIVNVDNLHNVCLIMQIIHKILSFQ